MPVVDTTGGSWASCPDVTCCGCIPGRTAIRDDIVDGVLRRTLWIDPLSVEVDVVDGVVSPVELESRSLARLLVELAEEVAGVVDVVDRLTWEQDDPA